MYTDYGKTNHVLHTMAKIDKNLFFKLIHFALIPLRKHVD